MLPIQQLTAAGFGAYRTSVNQQEHHEALLAAIYAGCNLLDTAGNYLNGASERLIGEVLSAHQLREKVFIVTKAGYIQGESLPLLDRVDNKLLEDEVITFSERMKYSIHPVYLELQLKLSMERMQVDYVDTFLLHNPEHYFRQTTVPLSRDEYYHRFRKAFEWLEEQVSKGVIRYYGVSSNTFPFDTVADDTTDLDRLLDIARSIKSGHHFKFIQFPFNLIEQQALTPHHNGRSLIAAAKENDIITIANRPLSSQQGNEIIRFASYEKETAKLQEEKDVLLVEKAITLIQQRMIRNGLEEDALSLPVVKIINDRWRSMGTPDAVEQVFQTHLYPLLRTLYDNNIPITHKRIYEKLKQLCKDYSRKELTLKANAWREKFVQNGFLPDNDKRKISELACEYCLKAGMDHVLVGMTKKSYVKSTERLFSMRD
ncbi:aldo/keto reductase [Chitinophaga pinensis]|uniref:Aldo/keto reductase n=1 Tax=Chitinophaga pinensis TaxID=79329 RepID=A0A5C6LV19_9BACT|nr:aldo/keto reductase [Chitinophaga pinensis]TWW00457.1 aldo/keto reductase [Chitinophaga pinensis]